MERDLEMLQGTWTIVHLEMDGRKMSGGAARIVVRGNRFTTIAMGAAYEGTVVVHQTTAPKSFELHFEQGPEKGNTNLGIYQLDGDTWRICLVNAEVGVSLLRPLLEVQLEAQPRHLPVRRRHVENLSGDARQRASQRVRRATRHGNRYGDAPRSEEHTSELQ